MASKKESVISVDGRGPEGKNIIGNLTEKEIRTFCEKVLGWRVLFTNIDALIPHNLSLGLFEESERGLDCLCSARNPFLNRRDGILVETKHVASGTHLRRGRLGDWIDTLREKIEGVRASRLQQDPDIVNNIDGTIQFGLLMIRFRRYEHADFWSKVAEVELSRSRGTELPVVMVITNDRLSPLVELFRREKRGAKIEYYYPKYLELSTPRFSETLAVSYLFSDIIFGRLVPRDDSATVRTFALIFEDPEPEALKVVSEMFDEFHSGEFDHIDKFFFASGNYYEESLYQDRLRNAGFGRVSSDSIVVLPQQFDLSFDISKELDP